MLKPCLVLMSLWVTTVGLAQSQSQNQTQTQNQTPPQGEPITIGAILPFSGGLELFGEQAKAGIDLAVSEINAAGGVYGRPLAVIYEDNKTDPKTSVEKANKLIRQDGAIALIGPITSNARDAIQPTSARFGVPLLYATNYEGGVCPQDNVFAFNTVPNQELAHLIPAMAIRSGKSFYLFGADYVWPQKMFEAADQLIADIDGEVVGKSLTPFGVKDFTPSIRQIMRSEADVLVFALPGADGVTFMKQAIELGLTKQVSIAFLGFSETYLGVFGAQSDLDIWVTVPFVSTLPAAQEFVQAVQASDKNIQGVSHYAFSHYTAIQFMANALNQIDANQLSAKSLSQELSSTGVDALTGRVIMDETHHVSLPMYLAHSQGERLEMVLPLGIKQPTPNCER